MLNSVLNPLLKKHFRQICFSVPNINFKYVYIKFLYLRQNLVIFKEKMHLPTRENYASEEKKCIPFVVILQVKTSIAIVYRPQEKNMQIVLNKHWTFIIIHNFIWQHFRLQHMVRMQHLMHIYIFGVSINRMLILQLKTFLSVKFMFSL